MEASLGETLSPGTMAVQPLRAFIRAPPELELASESNSFQISSQLYTSELMKGVIFFEYGD